MRPQPGIVFVSFVCAGERAGGRAARARSIRYTYATLGESSFAAAVAGRRLAEKGRYSLGFCNFPRANEEVLIFCHVKRYGVSLFVICLTKILFNATFLLDLFAPLARRF